MEERRPVAKIELKPGAHVHLMGICGTAMASLAGLLKDRGYRVSGSDQNVYPPMSTQLEKLGIPIMEGYRRENLTPKPDLVIVGNVITRKHEEAMELMQSTIPFASLPQAMGELVIENRHCVVVAGTHGKTTTTSMTAFVWDQLAQKPGFLIGGIPRNFDLSYRVPKGDWFVIEGDEYDTAFFDKVPKFIHYRPKSAILTSVEFDHADIYKNLDEVKSAFLRLVDLLPGGGLLVYNCEEKNIEDILAKRAEKFRQGQVRKVSFGLTQGDYQARQIQPHAIGTKFDLFRRGEKILTIQLQLIGEYNVKNALAVLALADCHNFDLKRVAEILSTFEGVKRRQEIIGSPRGITIYEDFAHHPTAVRMTLQALRQRHPVGKIFGIFEPRSATSRRKVFQKDYVEALRLADFVFLPPPYSQAAIPEEDRFSSEELIADLVAAGCNATLCAGVEDIVAKVAKTAKTGDTVVVMSNGGFGGIYKLLLTALT